MCGDIVHIKPCSKDVSRTKLTFWVMTAGRLYRHRISVSLGTIYLQCDLAIDWSSGIKSVYFVIVQGYR